jgi:hypothetical protein
MHCLRLQGYSQPGGKVADFTSRKPFLNDMLLFVVYSAVFVLSLMLLLTVFVVSPMKMANSSRRVSCGLDFCSVPDIRGSLQGASEAGYSMFTLCFIISLFVVFIIMLK